MDAALSKLLPDKLFDFAIIIQMPLELLSGAKLANTYFL